MTANLAARLREAADKSAENWADLTLWNEGPKFARASAAATYVERLMREAANELERLGATP